MLETVQLDTKLHNRDTFDCGVPALNDFLAKRASQSAKRSITKTWVLVDSQNPSDIIGFYTLEYGTVVSPSGSKLTTYPHPLAVLKLVRMAVSIRHQKKGFGEQMLIEVIKKTARTAYPDSIAPVIGLFVDPKEGAETFYENYGFTSVDTGDGQHLWLPINSCIEIDQES